MKTTTFIDLNTIYEQRIETENWVISETILSDEEVRMEKMRNFRNYWYVAGLQANFKYILLRKKGSGVWMSDTPMERNSNRNFIQKANGDVLIFGLGLGLIVFPLLDNPEVKSIRVIEKEKEVIDLISPYIKAKDTFNKVTIVEGDCFEYKTKEKFDVIYGDIWRTICIDNYEEMKQLTRAWKNRVNRENPNAFIDHWLKDYLKGEIQKEKRDSRSWWF
jgi:hypothetical protein